MGGAARAKRGKILAENTYELRQAGSYGTACLVYFTMCRLYYASTVILLAFWSNAATVNGDCFWPLDVDMLQEMIEDHSSIDIEFVTEPHFLCRSVSGQSATVGVIFTCIGGLFCNGDRVGVLYDLQCVEDTWSIIGMEIGVDRISDLFFDNCSYCLSDEKRRAMFPSRPDNTYQYIERVHCLCKLIVHAHRTYCAHANSRTDAQCVSQ